MSSATGARISQQSTGDTQFNVRDAALRGASSAFSKPPLKPKPQVNTYTGGQHGALLAANKVGTGTPRNTSPVRRDWTGGSTRSAAARPAASPRPPLDKSNSSSTLSVPEDQQLDRIPSPSNIAAKLAAARFSPMKPVPQAAVTPVKANRDDYEEDAMPPKGVVGNAVGKLDSQKVNLPPPQSKEGTRAQPVKNTVPVPEESRPTDETPIPPTNSLVSIFESNRSHTPATFPSEPLIVSQQAPPPVRSPKPQRNFKLPPAPRQNVVLERKKTRSPPPVKPKPQLESIPPIDGPRDSMSFSKLRKDSLGVPPSPRQKPAQLASISTTSPRASPKAERGPPRQRTKSQDLTRSVSRRSMTKSVESMGTPSSPSSFVSAKEEQEEEKPKPIIPPPRRSARTKSAAVPAELKSRPETPRQPQPGSPRKLASPVPPPEKYPPRPASAIPSSTSPNRFYHSNYQRESVKSITKHMTGESLSDAIVGAALASSRNVSPAPPSTAAPPIYTRQKHHHPSPFHHRTPSPPKSAGTKPNKMRTTMRKDPSSSDDEDETERYKRKGTRIMGMGRKHPNKHHEGTRKRWRDQITDRERKRYEGVWAANKGLFLPISNTSRSPSPDDPSLDVLNLVTKEIWSRSRLPDHVLEEVWDLVDSRGVGRLRRDEFVVGMWLVDQRLKGRKLPVRVSDSVWASVRGVGIKVKVRK